MNDKPESDQGKQEPQAPSSSNRKGSPLTYNLSSKQVVGVVVLAAIVVAVIWFYDNVRAWVEQSARTGITSHDSPPEEWKGLRLGITRQQVAQMLVDSKARWPSIQKPGMAPTPWAAQVNLEFNGHPAREFSVRFSDDQRWDYGRHPAASDDVVDVETLIGGLDPQASLIGVGWMVERTQSDIDHEMVPLEVLEVFGTPESERTDVTGDGKVYEWNWPTLKAYYTTVDGRLTMQSPEAVGA